MTNAGEYLSMGVLAICLCSLENIHMLCQFFELSVFLLLICKSLPLKPQLFPHLQENSPFLMVADSGIVVTCI